MGELNEQEFYADLVENDRNLASMIRGIREMGNASLHLEKTNPRDIVSCRYMIMPTSRRRRWWDVFIMLMTIVSSVVVPLTPACLPTVSTPSPHHLLTTCPTTSTPQVPLTLAFEAEIAGNEEGALVLRLVEYVCDAAFMLDLLMNFVTGVEIDKKIILNTQIISKLYLKGWFTVDFLASFPFDALVSASLGQDEQDVARMFSLLRTFKLFRLVRCQRYLKKIEQYLAFNPAYMRLFTMLAALIIGWHWLGCLWSLVATNSLQPT